MLIRFLLATLLVTTIGGAFAAEPSDGNISATLEKMSASTPAEKSKYVADALNEMRAAQRTMLKIQEKAPECVESQLPLVNSLVEVSTFVEGEMRRWQQQGDAARADTEFRKIVIALSTVRTMLAEGNGCATGKSPEAADASSTLEYSGANQDLDETAAADTFSADFDVADDAPDISPSS